MNASSCSNTQGNSGGPNGGGDEEGTRLFIIQVKEEVERCLEAGMSKEQMFRELREKGLHLAIAFAVYKELRDQNEGFFEEYYGQIDLRKQAERLQRLLHQYRTARDAAAGARALRTATAPTTMAIPHNVGSSEHQTVPAGSAPSQQAGQLPAGEQLHPSKHWLPNGGFRGLPSAAGPSNAVMTGSWPPFARRPRHGEQDEPLQQWPSNPSFGFYGQPPLSGEEQLPPLSAEELLENQNHHSHVGSLEFPR